MNYSAKKNDRRIIYSISKCKNDANLYKGWFMYTSDKGKYISTEIKGKDEWSVMEKMFFDSIRQIAKCYYENIEELTDDCWNQFFNSKQPLLNF